MKKSIVFLFLMISVLAACKKDNSPMGMIYGKWQGLKWMVRGEPMSGFDISVINFEFKKDSSYTAKFGIQNEEGTFNLNNNCFNATSTYKSKKKCPILKMSQDTMIWMMDSVQQEGNLYLIRIN